MSDKPNDFVPANMEIYERIRMAIPEFQWHVGQREIAGRSRRFVTFDFYPTVGARLDPPRPGRSVKLKDLVRHFQSIDQGGGPLFDIDSPQTQRLVAAKIREQRRERASERFVRRRMGDLRPRGWLHS